MNHTVTPARDTLVIHVHADQSVTIEGVTLTIDDAMLTIEQAAKRRPAPLLKFVRDDGAGYETIGRIIYRAGRAGFPDESFSLLGQGSTPPYGLPLTPA